MTALRERPLITPVLAVTISNYGIAFKPVRISKQARGGQIDKASWAAWNGILPGAQITGCLGDCSVLRDCWGISPGPRDQPCGA